MARFKEGVAIDFATLKPSTAHLVAVAELVYLEFGLEAVITSGHDGQHSAGSLHYSGDAVDFRTRTLPTDEARQQLATRIRTRLGRAYDCVLEADHLHVEYDPT